MNVWSIYLDMIGKFPAMSLDDNNNKKEYCHTLERDDKPLRSKEDRSVPWWELMIYFGVVYLDSNPSLMGLESLE